MAASSPPMRACCCCVASRRSSGWPTAGILAAARPTSDLSPDEWECEPNYYLGLHAPLADVKKPAEGYFRRSVATNVSSFIEYQYAEPELRRLGAKQAP